MDDTGIGIVGGGIVGLAVARELVRRQPGREVVVFEQEEQLATHQTGHNSGVVHAGVYYAPGSLKARLCTRGRLLLRDFCAEHDLPYEACGKLVVAVDEVELARLDALEERSHANGVPGLRRLDADEIARVEPEVRGLSALHSPETAITDFAAVARAIADEVVAAGGQVLTSSPVTALRSRPTGVDVRAGGRHHRLERLIVCAGVQGDRLARLAGAAEAPRIVPFRGEYLQVSVAKQDLVSALIYPVPDPQYPFLGVHLTRRVDGGLELGPNAVLALDREGYGRADVDLGDLRDIVTWPGFWRLAARHWRTGVEEVWGSLSTRAYLRQAQRYVPAIGLDDVERARVGIRAQAVERDGSLVDDFRIDEVDRVVCVRNAPSPAATSSLAIAEHLVDLLAA